MGCLGNGIWLIFGGLVTAISWLIVGLVWCITIVGIPVGLQCFKLAGLTLMPFGKAVQHDSTAASFLLNVIWFIFGGLGLAIEHLIFGLILCITIIGIPFGQQQFKLAGLALRPFGAVVVAVHK